MRTAVLLAAGRGKRLKPYTDTTPKPLLPWGGRPTLDHIVDSLLDAGIDRLCVVTHHLHEQVDAYFARRFAFEQSIEVLCVRQPQMLGTANALQCAMHARADWFEQDFLLTATDYLVSPHFYPDLLSFHINHTMAISVSLKSLPDDELSSRSSVRFGGEDVVLEIVEKPEPGTAPSNLGANLVFILPAAIALYVDLVEPSARGEFEIQSAINAYLQNSGDARGLLQTTPAEWQPPPIESDC